MNNKTVVFTLVSIVVIGAISIGIIFQFYNISNNNLPDKLNLRLSESAFLFKSKVDLYNEVIQNLHDVIICDTNDNIQEKLLEARGKILVLTPGIHLSYGAKVPENTILYIPKNATIKLADDLVIDQTDYPEGTGDAVLKVYGTEKYPIHNVNIILEGTIDANKKIHPYKSGGIEGIDLKWVVNSSIMGQGNIQNANADGIDLDAVKDVLVWGITTNNNEGSGVHFGSPRPIKPSKRNLVIGVKSINNGFARQRNGFDQSWPNVDGVTFINCISMYNYKNWMIHGRGGIVLSSQSIYKQPSNSKDELSDSFYAEVNGEVYSRSLKSKMQSLNNKLSLKYQKGITIENSGYYLLFGSIEKDDSRKGEFGLYLNNNLLNVNYFIDNLNSRTYLYNISHLNKGDSVQLISSKLKNDYVNNINSSIRLSYIGNLTNSSYLNFHLGLRKIPVIGNRISNFIIYEK